MAKRWFSKLRQHPKGFAFASGHRGKDAFVPPRYRVCEHVLAGAGFKAEVEASPKGPRVVSYWLACQPCVDAAQTKEAARKARFRKEEAMKAVAKAAGFDWNPWHYQGEEREQVFFPMPEEIENLCQRVEEKSLSTKRPRWEKPSPLEQEVARLAQAAQKQLREKAPKIDDQRVVWAQQFSNALIKGEIISCSCGNKGDTNKIPCGETRMALNYFSYDDEYDCYRAPQKGHEWTKLSQQAREELKKLKEEVYRSGAWAHWDNVKPVLVEVDKNLIWGCELKVDHHLTEEEVETKEASERVRNLKRELTSVICQTNHFVYKRSISKEVQADLDSLRRSEPKELEELLTAEARLVEMTQQVKQLIASTTEAEQAEKDAKRAAEEAEKAEAEAKQQAREDAIIAAGGMVNFTAWHRRGGSNQGDAWVIRPDGTCRPHDRDDVPRHKQDGHYTWDFIRPEELVLKYTKDRRADPFVCTIVQQPKCDLTEAQIDATQKIEQEIEAPSGAFGLTKLTAQAPKPEPMNEAMAKLLSKWGDKRKKK